MVYRSPIAPSAAPITHIHKTLLSAFITIAKTNAIIQSTIPKAIINIDSFMFLPYSYNPLIKTIVTMPIKIAMVTRRRNFALIIRLISPLHTQ